MQDLVEQYLSAFNETDAARRGEVLSRLYTHDATYTDPHADLSGPEAINDFIAQTQERFPGITFRLRGEVDSHHQQARFQWQAGPDTQPDEVVGFDVIVAVDGRISSVYGFSDPAPSA